MHALANLRDQTEHIGAGGAACVNEKIGVAVADAGIADGKALEPQFINHASGGPARRILENAAGAFLIERLTGAAFFVADANALENFAVWLGGELQFHREHNIIGRKRSVTIFEGNLFFPQRFNARVGGAIEFHLADVGTDLRAIGAGIHAQGAPDGSGHADEAFHAAEVVLGAKGDGAAQVGGRIHVRGISLQAHVGILVRQLQNDPGELRVSHQQIRAAAEKFVSDARAAKQSNELRQRAMPANQQQIRGAADAERGVLGKRSVSDVLDAELGESGQNAGISNPHFEFSRYAPWRLGMKCCEPRSSANSDSARLTLPAPMASTASPARTSRSSRSMLSCNVAQ